MNALSMSFDALHDAPDALRISTHAHRRMDGRRLSLDAVSSSLAWGRELHTRGAVVFALGHREVETIRRRNGIDLSRHEGVQVVCVDETIVTVYRNRDFRGLRDRASPRRRHVPAWTPAWTAA